MNKYKIAITGHTSGIGQACYVLLRERGHEVIGFSRSTGHDLSDPATLGRLIEETSGYDVFINNAFYDWAQVDLLFALFESWKAESRLIINVGSDSGDGVKNFFHPYATKKAALDHGTAQLNNLANSKCRVTTIKAGWVRTPQIEHLKISEPQLDPAQVAKMVDFVLNLPPGVHIPTLTMEAY